MENNDRYLAALYRRRADYYRAGGFDGPYAGELAKVLSEIRKIAPPRSASSLTKTNQTLKKPLHHKHSNYSEANDAQANNHIEPTGFWHQLKRFMIG